MDWARETWNINCWVRSWVIVVIVFTVRRHKSMRRNVEKSENLCGYEPMERWSDGAMNPNNPRLGTGQMSLKLNLKPDFTWSDLFFLVQKFTWCDLIWIHQRSELIGSDLNWNLFIEKLNGVIQKSCDLTICVHYYYHY